MEDNSLIMLDKYVKDCHMSVACCTCSQTVVDIDEKTTWYYKQLNLLKRYTLILSTKGRPDIFKQFSLSEVTPEIHCCNAELSI